MPNTFNLSKTEFTAYLECPIKFYLQKEQNLTTKQGPRGGVNSDFYPPHLSGGMIWHDRLAEFYRNTAKDLLAGTVSEREVLTHHIYQLFWQRELHRYEVDPSHWFPLAFEYYFSSPTMRGKIDRIDPLGATECCLVEYKARPGTSGFLDEELLFYALLASESDDFCRTIGRPVTRVACYFYRTGEWYTREIVPEELSSFREFLSPLRSEMLTGNWARKHACSLSSHDCSYAVVCTKILDRFLISSRE